MFRAERAVRLGKKLVHAGLRLFQTSPDAFLTRVKGVIHVGASTGQEREVYARRDLNVAWIEPIPDVFARLQANLQHFPKQRAYRYLITDRDDQAYTFHVASNNGESSSIYPFGEGTAFWPEISFSPQLSLQSVTLSSWVKRENIDLADFDALVMDTQGSELLVLKGAGEVLSRLKYIRSEAADFEIYQGCCRLDELRQFLEQRAFVEECTAKSACDGRRNCYEIVYRNTRVQS